MTDLSLPNAEIRLQAHLGNRYIDSDWQPALKAVMDAEGSTEVALKAIHDIENEAKRRPGIVIRIVPSSHQDIPQISEAETQLMQTVQNLKARNRIFGEPPTLGDLLEPPEEKEIRAEPSDEPDKTDEVIAHIVSKEIATVDAEVIEDNSDDEDEPVAITRSTKALF
ncbi:hypothetical protein L210DRAFT_3508850 [Boletus edulis BED1]|uniref:Uncharacterized protein n=2 Tax=Boletus edulis BED1 TaxID=1328754 RepID=A0AAD4BG84_BOLED|nr:hypothetical protein L210DRAFT_3508850 [Boletus edulis BED1]